MTYKKVGGLHFIKLGRFGMSFFWSRQRISRAAERKARVRMKRATAELAALNAAPIQCKVDSVGQYGMPFPDYQRYYRD
jgi:hypothetical protein